ncbi:MAG TPA: hypothetical protein P5262_00455 [Candidatus Moranbacteria bacterium]|nr:hypothetical protein [Candidatus Moranbacteria bacterium]
MAMLKVSYFCGFCRRKKEVFVNPNFKKWICCEAEGCLILQAEIPRFFEILEGNDIGSLFIMQPGEFLLQNTGRNVATVENSGLILILRKVSAAVANGDRLIESSYNACLR